jgi:hypothetical protein
MSFTNGENSLGWTHNFGGVITKPNGRPEMACMRQIAHELLCTIQRYVPEFAAHADPVIPQTLEIEQVNL